jgi:hypothetical protein
MLVIIGNEVDTLIRYNRGVALTLTVVAGASKSGSVPLIRRYGAPLCAPNYYEEAAGRIPPIEPPAGYPKPQALAQRYSKRAKFDRGVPPWSSGPLG